MNPILNLLMTGWSMDTFLENSHSLMEGWGGIIVAIAGIVMVIVGIVKLAVGLMQSGRGQTNWVMTVLLIVLGAILAFAGGWDILSNVGQGAESTIYSLGEDMILQGLHIW